MGKPNVRFVAKAVPGVGWRIWNRRTNRWWGNYFAEFPQETLDELNGPRRPEQLSELAKPSYAEHRRPEADRSGS